MLARRIFVCISSMLARSVQTSVDLNGVASLIESDSNSSVASLGHEFVP